jgi:hypothetical protein
VTIPACPKIYHIVHVDRLPSIIADGCLWCDAAIAQRNTGGTTIGMNKIKQRRLNELTLSSHPGLYVGQCVPFYFCPRSIMLFLIHKKNAELSYKGGQEPIIHLEGDLLKAVNWANQHNLRWSFTLSNAGSYYFEDCNDLARLPEIDWLAVQATNWWGQKQEGKQAEFLVENTVPWHLVERIGVKSRVIYDQVIKALPRGGHHPQVDVRPDWYY